MSYDPRPTMPIESATKAVLQAIGEDPHRGGLLETPSRVAKAWLEMTRGYVQNAADVLKVFEDGAEKVDQMVVVAQIPVHSMCEHHMLPFFGEAHIGYIPNGKVVGLSKFARLVDVFARRLQVQERMTQQIAQALVDHVQPLGVGVIVSCRHLCMEMRGVSVPGTVTRTTALRGRMMEDYRARDEFLEAALVNGWSHRVGR